MFPAWFHALAILALLLGGCADDQKTLVLLHTTDEHSHLLGFGPEADSRKYTR